MTKSTLSAILIVEASKYPKLRSKELRRRKIRHLMLGPCGRCSRKALLMQMAERVCSPVRGCCGCAHADHDER